MPNAAVAPTSLNVLLSLKLLHFDGGFRVQQVISIVAAAYNTRRHFVLSMRHVTALSELYVALMFLFASTPVNQGHYNTPVERSSLETVIKRAWSISAFTSMDLYCFNKIPSLKLLLKFSDKQKNV